MVKCVSSMWTLATNEDSSDNGRRQLEKNKLKTK